MTGLGELLPRYRRPLTCALVVLWAAALVLTHIPPSDMPSPRVSDRVLHVIGYWGLATALAATLVSHGVAPRRRWALGLAILAAYGAFDELTQPIFHRHASLYDWLADLVGLALGMLMVEALVWVSSRGRRTGAVL